MVAKRDLIAKEDTIKGLEKFIEESIGEFELGLKQSSNQIGEMSQKYTESVRENDKLTKKIELIQERLASNEMEILEKNERIKTCELELSESRNWDSEANKRILQLQIDEVEKLKQENLRLDFVNIKQQKLLKHNSYDLAIIKQMLAERNQEIVLLRQEASNWYVAYGSLKSEVVAMRKSHSQPHTLVPAA